MSDISDELREMADERFIGIANTRVHDLADRIDAEMVELPRDADGELVHIGDTVYACDDPSLEYKVSYIEYRRDSVTVGIAKTGVQTYRKTQCVSHKRPDSLERIVDDMGADIVSMPVGFTSDDASDLLRKYRDRIKALAEKGGGDD